MFVRTAKRSRLALQVLNFCVQRLFGLNCECPYPVNFTSRIMNAGKFRFCRDEETLACLARSTGCYIQANNGVFMGRRVQFGPGVKIISANHVPGQRSEWVKAPPIYIGDDVWLGANVVLLPGVRIPRGCVVGAGAVVTKAFTREYRVIAGNPARDIASTESVEEPRNQHQVLSHSNSH